VKAVVSTSITVDLVRRPRVTKTAPVPSDFIGVSRMRVVALSTQEIAWMNCGSEATICGKMLPVVASSPLHP
jgi:hypothetical protein